MPICPWKTDSRMSAEPSSFDAASTSQVRLQGYIPWRVDGKAAGRPVAIKNKKFQKTPTILGLELGTTKRNTLREKPLANTVHLGQDCEANLRYLKNHLWHTAGELFRETETLVSGQTESAGISVIDFKIWGWCRPACCTVELVNVSLRKPTPSPILCSVLERWETILLNLGRAKFNGVRDNNCFKDLNRIDGQLVEFEWKIFPGLTTTGFLNLLQQMMGELQCEPENFTGRNHLHVNV